MFKNLSLAKKLYIGFGVVLALLIVVSLISYNTIDSASGNFVKYRGLARDTNLMGRVQANMLMIRMNVKDFIITGSEKDQQQYATYVKKTHEFMETALKEIQNPERARLVRQASSALKEYEDAFKKVEKARVDRNGLVLRILDVKGPFMENTLTDIMESAQKDNDMTAAIFSAYAMKHLLLARLYMAKFLDANEQRHVDRVHEEFSKMQKQLEILDRELQNPQRRKWLAVVEDAKKTYTTSFDQLVRVIFDRNKVISGTLDRLGPEIAKALEDTKLSVKTDQDQLGPKVQADNDRGIVFLVILAIVAIVFGVFIAFYIVRIITIPISKASEFVNIIAGGDFSKQIDINQTDEVGLMAKALSQMGTVLKGAISSISDTMNKVSQGDFTQNVDDAGMAGELILIKDAINNSIKMLSDTILQVVTATDQVNSGSGQISSASQSLASGTSQQAASLEEISSTMAEVGSRAKDNNDNANQAAQLTSQAMETANRGNRQMQEMLASMDSINSSSSDISKIIKVIDEIAFQTNLLALNAAVEAARAGKYGKGFAVVAEEVRNLAARSAEAAKNTTELIENSIKEVEAGVDNAGKTAEVLKEINDGITKVNDLVSEISASSQEQSTSTDEINKSLNQVNTVVQQNSSISEETASAAEELSGQSMQLQALMGRFKLNQVSAYPTNSPGPVAVREDSPVEPTTEAQKMITLDDDEFGKY